jgi:hypothetical protein
MNNEERQLLEEELAMQEEIRLLEEEENKEEKEELEELEEDNLQTKEVKETVESATKEEKEEGDIKKKICYTKKKCKKKRCVQIGVGIIVLLAVFIGLSVAVYAKDFRSDYSRHMAKTLPYPAMMIGGDVITLQSVLTEYDTMASYLEEIAGYPGLPNEQETIVQVLETVKNKVVVQKLAEEFGIVLDETKVDEAYLSMSGGSENEEIFLGEMESIFGMNKEEMIEQVVVPLVLAQQVSEEVLANEEIQKERKDLAETTRQRLVDGEEFAVVAADVNGQFNNLADGDLGVVKYSEIPAEWVDAVSALEAGGYSEVVTAESVFAHYIFLAGEKTELEEDVEIQLSVVMVPYAQLLDITEKYLEEHFFWQFIDEEGIEGLVNGDLEDEEEEDGDDDGEGVEEIADAPEISIEIEEGVEGDGTEE